MNFNRNPDIDKKLQSDGKIPFPENLIIDCKCGTQIDLTDIKNEIESQFGKFI